MSLVWLPREETVFRPCICLSMYVEFGASNRFLIPLPSTPTNRTLIGDVAVVAQMLLLLPTTVDMIAQQQQLQVAMWSSSWFIVILLIDRWSYQFSTPG